MRLAGKKSFGTNALAYITVPSVSNKKSFLAISGKNFLTLVRKNDCVRPWADAANYFYKHSAFREQAATSLFPRKPSSKPSNMNERSSLLSEASSWVSKKVYWTDPISSSAPNQGNSLLIQIKKD